MIAVLILAAIMLCACAAPAAPSTSGESPAPASEPSGSHSASTGGKIEFVLNQLERTKTWPLETTNNPVLTDNNDFVVAFINISSINEGHVWLQEGSYIIDSEGKEYKEEDTAWRGIKFGYIDPSDVSKMKGAELTEGAEGTLVFQLPVSAQPVKLRLAYLFFQSWSKDWEPEFQEECYIDIPLD